MLHCPLWGKWSANVRRSTSVDFLLFVHTELARAHVNQQKETAHDGEDLEEVVLGKVLVWVALVEL